MCCVDEQTFAGVLNRTLRADPGRPLVTFYDESSGERVELSATTYANWVAKTASLLVEEHDLERGDTLQVDLPAHWLTTVFLGAAWSAGLVVGPVRVTEHAAEPDAVVCGPAGLARWSERAGDLPVLACSLLPLGVRFADPLPAGVHDVGVEVWSQPDSFVSFDPPGPDDPALTFALAGGSGPTSHRELWSSAAAGTLLTDGDRLLLTANPASPPGVAAFTEALVRGGSLVLVTGVPETSSDRLDRIADAERVTHRFTT